jgi:polysaccharide pyruvyl transferase WcaK-like protein
MPVKILCSGGWGYGNLGDDLILQGTLNGLQKAFPRAEITVTSASPTDTNSINNVHSIPSIRNLCLSSARTRLKTAIRYGAAYACLSKTVRKNAHLLSRIRDFYDGYDLFVQAGGGYFNSVFWWALPWYALELSGAIDTYTRVAVIGQQWGRSN